MSEIVNQNLSGVSESLLVTLYLRAMESQRPDALIKDEKAVALVTQMSYDFDQIRRIPLSEANKLVIILRNREFDRYARDFLAHHPEAVVVHIGCGLDSRFERVDNGQVEWYDLDLPDVIALRRKFIGDERERYHLLGCSMLDNAWLETVSAHRQRPFLFMAEGVFMYFKEAQVKSLVLKLRPFSGCGAGLRHLFAAPCLGAQPPNVHHQGRFPGPLGDLARSKDRRLGQWHPPARRVGILGPT